MPPIPAGHRFFCHACRSHVLLRDPELLICPSCTSDFLEMEDESSGPEIAFGGPSDLTWFIRQIEDNLFHRPRRSTQRSSTTFSSSSSTTPNHPFDTFTTSTSPSSDTMATDTSTSTSPSSTSSSTQEPHDTQSRRTSSSSSTSTSHSFTSQSSSDSVPNSTGSQPHQHFMPFFMDIMRFTTSPASSSSSSSSSYSSSTSSSPPPTQSSDSTSSSSSPPPSQEPPLRHAAPVFNLAVELANMFNLPVQSLAASFGSNPRPSSFMSEMTEIFGDLRNYAFGPDQFDRIISDLMEQSQPNRPEPASAQFISKLPDIEIIEPQVEKGMDCVICQEKFNLSEIVTKLTCDHLFHKECIVTWLKYNGTCPTCRFPVESTSPPRSSTSSSSNQSTNSDTNRSFHFSRSSSSSSSGSSSHSTPTRQTTGTNNSSMPGSWDPAIEDLD